MRLYIWSSKFGTFKMMAPQMMVPECQLEMVQQFDVLLASWYVRWSIRGMFQVSLML